MAPSKQTLIDTWDFLKGCVVKTPVVPIPQSNFVPGATGTFYFKCEGLQKTGSFKFRGASNAIRSIDSGVVVTHSSGNHGSALAMAAKERGLGCHVIMPENSTKTKINAVQANGATIHFCPPGNASRISMMEKVLADTSGTFVHPYDDPQIIAGQATAAMEMLEDLPNLDAIVTPVGGGGLISGTALATRFFGKSTAVVVGGEPELADDTIQSIAKGSVVPLDQSATIADGLRANVGALNFSIIQEFVEKVFPVSEDRIRTCQSCLNEYLDHPVELSSAVAIDAAISLCRENPLANIGIILTGSNV